MADIYEIPLDAGAQSFTISLGGVQYRYRLIYRVADGGGWFLDIERVDGTDAILGIPLLLNVDLLEQYQHKGFGHLWATRDRGIGEHPTYDDMGNGISLFWSEEWTIANGFVTSS